MVTGIISAGTFLLGPSWLSRALLVAAAAGLAVLSAALAVRLIIFRSSVAASIQAPERVFVFFTIMAGIDVPGVWLAAAGHLLATAILAGLAAAVRLVLTYGVPACCSPGSATRSSAAPTAPGCCGWSAPGPSRSQARGASVTGGLRCAALRRCQ